MYDVYKRDRNNLSLTFLASENSISGTTKWVSKKGTIRLIKSYCAISTLKSILKYNLVCIENVIDVTLIQ